MTPQQRGPWSPWRWVGAMAVFAALWCQSAARADLIVAPHPNFRSSATGTLFLLGTPGASGMVSSRSGAFSQGFTLDATGMAMVAMTSSQFLGAPGVVSDRALRVTGTRVAGYFLNHMTGSADMSYVFEDSVLGTEYRVLAYPGLNSGFPAQMSVTAVRDATVVTVRPSAALSTSQPMGVPFNVTLDAGQSVLYTATGLDDLTGSTITATQPVAVFAGAQCAQVPVGTAFCDHLYSQLPPVDKLSTHHVVPATDHTGGAGNLVRVLAVRDATAVVVNGGPPVTLAAGQFHEVVNAQSLDIASSQPVLVGQYLQGIQKTGQGDPAFSVVPGADQALSHYAFAVPMGTDAFTANVLNIAIPTASVASLRLNGNPVGATFTPLAGTAYSVGNVAVPPGAGRIQADVPFVATLSGFKNVTSYHTLLGASYARGVSPTPDLAVALSASASSVAVGSTVNLTVTVANVGLGNSVDGEVALSLPASVALDLASLPLACAASTPSQLRCALNPLMPSASQIMGITVRALADGTATLQASVSGVSGEPVSQR
ncbi:MAG: hypothetical protein F9K35_13110, partial [Burkholderiaceae bacterium]